jgi:hypothetical protein
MENKILSSNELRQVISSFTKVNTIAESKEKKKGNSKELLGKIIV